MKNLAAQLTVGVICFIVCFNYCKAESSYIKDVALIKDDWSGTTELIKSYLNDLGYTADILNSQYVTVEILDQYRLTILSAGNNPYACVSIEERQALQSYLTVSHGKLIIEGGQLGYISAVFPYYLAFRMKVMKIISWDVHEGGDLVLGENNSQYNLANIPNKLPSTIKLNVSNEFDQDVCTNDETSRILYSTSQYSDKVGVLVAPNMEFPQIINYYINFSSIEDQTIAKNLLENSIYNLIGEPVGISGMDQEIPVEYTLSQNYPNPFNPSTKIIYSLPKAGNISLIVFDALGREAVILEEGFRNAGSYERFFDASSLASGIYTCKLVAGSTTITKKMLLVK